jgi:hypothetical protein
MVPSLRELARQLTQADDKNHADGDEKSEHGKGYRIERVKRGLH